MLGSPQVPDGQVSTAIFAINYDAEIEQFDVPSLSDLGLFPTRR